ncbi:MAG: DUF4097 family beta strand repeat-containing protein [Acidobacteriota bacterium]
MKRLKTLTCSLGLVASFGLAQTRVDELRPLAPGGVVEIHCATGTVRVTGWERPELHAGGWLGRGMDRIEVTGDPARTCIRVVFPARCTRCEGSDLVIRVPATATLEIETGSADVDVQGVTGEVHLKSSSGELRVAGAPRALDARSDSGSVTVAPPAATPGTEEGGAGGAAAHWTTIQRCAVETGSGEIRLVSRLAPGASVTLTSVSGGIEVVLPADVEASFDLRTTHGEIENELHSDSHPVSQPAGAKELRYTAGRGGSQVVASSFSGHLRLRPPDPPPS